MITLRLRSRDIMKRMLAISDVHGKIEEFELLLEKANYNASRDQLILVGDYVDRGPDSRAVLNRVMELKAEGAIVLRGNHDDMMVAAYHNEPGALARWEKNGALYTLQCYDSTIKDMTMPDSEAFHDHVTFLENLDYYYETDDYIFVHAGVDPKRTVEDTDPYDLVWIRDEFHQNYSGTKTVVFGHTPTPMLNNSYSDHTVYFGENNIIGIDGGAVFGGQLNCLELPSKKVYSIKG